MLHTSDFDFELPTELIASHPLERRDASRMLIVMPSSPLARGVPAGRGVAIYDKHIRDFLDFLRPGDVVVFNNSRVIPARFDADGHEITLHTAVSDKNWWGLCKKFNKINVGDILTLADGTQITVMDKDEESGLLVRFNCDDVFAVLNKVGKMPLPPYMKREAEVADQTRYQTVYADPLGSMAAPTAGLHFTDDLMREIEQRGAKIVKVTLHVGAGTWMPVKTENLNEHKMHSEWCQITPEQADIINNATRVIAVGTTSMRTLESAAIITPTPAGSTRHPSEEGNLERKCLMRTAASKKDVCLNLPRNSKLKQRASELRKAGSLPEALLWKEIKGKQINGVDFDRQKVIGNYIVDFFCPTYGAVVEIDDKTTHDLKGAYDEKREEYLKNLGLHTMHISAQDVLKNPATAAQLVSNFIMNIAKQSVNETKFPSCGGVPGGTRRGGGNRVAPFCGTTDIFITPGYKFRAVDVLLTNFHLPKSTLFMLVSAFSGLDEMKAAYAHAIAEKYRFFSYGDCCLLFKKECPDEL
jgi:S-adenosylmethionine:tRNA ribosyltransferase-isomerase